jgi:hypothetical protein
MASKMVRMLKAGKNSKEGERYKAQVMEMAEAVRAWVKDNPGRTIKIQRNSGPSVGIISTLADSIKHKYVSVNDDASVMLRELGWLDDQELMPTIIMAEVAIEVAFSDKC